MTGSDWHPEANDRGCTVQESELDSCTALRHVLVGGEALPPVLASRFGQRLPNAHLHNAYGPTETTVDATGKSSKIPQTCGNLSRKVMEGNGDTLHGAMPVAADRKI
jgi:acyl-CoA synthetase (AMP-forming)/AMP-acid ligase II